VIPLSGGHCILKKINFVVVVVVLILIKYLPLGRGMFVISTAKGS
jgi:hypothetical protein